jgi:hypothetical protein
MEAAHLGEGKAVGVTQRVDSGAKEGFVHVDIAETGDERLIEEHALQATAPATQRVR